MYINSNMSDEEVIRCTFGLTSPLIRILTDRLTDRNRQLDRWLEWSDRMDDLMADRPGDLQNTPTTIADMLAERPED